LAESSRHESQGSPRVNRIFLPQYAGRNCEDWPESGSEGDTFGRIDDLDDASQSTHTQDEDDLFAGIRCEDHGALSRTPDATWTSKAEITSSSNELQDSSRHGNKTVTTTMVGDLAKYPAIDPLTATRHHLSYDVSVEVGFDSLKNPGHKCFQCRYRLFSPIQSQLKSQNAVDTDSLDVHW